jgi:DNA helicase-2/ATP-dependent DNA helicase PcrA
MGNVNNLSNLNPNQRDAASHFKGPGLVLSVPGSGKTTILINRIFNLVEKHNINPGNILTITFSKYSALDMERRFDSLGNGSYSSNFSTIHRLCYMIVRKYSKHKGIEYRLLESNENITIAGKRITKLGLVKELASTLKKEFINDELGEELSSSISLYKNRCQDAELLSELEDKHPFFLSLYKGYENFKEENNLIDFDDMLSKAYEILSLHTGFLNNLRKKYQFIQVDEAQDTSEIQHRIISLISGDENIFMVADDDQTIYSFRGAYPQRILDFESNYPSAKIYRISTNYRSTDNILSLSEKLISNNKKRYSKTLEGIMGKKEDVKYYVFDTLWDSMDYIVDKIRDDINLSTAILYRNNFTMNYVTEYFNRNSIDFNSKESNTSLINNPFVRDIWDFYQFSMDPSNWEVLNRIYFKFNSYISKKQMTAISSIHGDNLIEQIISSTMLKDFQIKSFRKLKDLFEEICELSPLQGLDIILKELGYEEYVKDNQDRFSQGLEYYNHSIDILKIILEDVATIYDISQRIYKPRYFNRSKTSNITVSTIHSVKGMEYDRVFILDLFDGMFPRESVLNENRSELEEERRLLYVALTRSKEELEIINVNFRNGNYSSPGLFQAELLDTGLLNPERVRKDSNACGKISEGDTIVHKKFGNGRIISRDGDILEIAFMDCTKKLSFSIMVSNNLIVAP